MTLSPKELAENAAVEIMARAMSDAEKGTLGASYASKARAAYRALIAANVIKGETSEPE